jgi:hypothetical protein
MKKITKPILSKRAFFFFCLSGATLFISGTVDAQVFEPGVRSLYSGFLPDVVDTLSADTLTLVPLAKDNFEAQVEQNAEGFSGKDTVSLDIPFPGSDSLLLGKIVPSPINMVCR